MTVEVEARPQPQEPPRRKGRYLLLSEVPDKLPPASDFVPDPKRPPSRKLDLSTSWTRHLQRHPIIPAVFYGALTGWLLWSSVERTSVLNTAGWFLAAFAFWTFAEYFVHRGPLHVDPDAWYTFGIARQHATHHLHPEDVSMVIISPMQTVPVLIAVWGVLGLALPDAVARPVTAGIVFGYLSYETLHYAFHAPISLRWKWMQALRKHHARHHYDTPDRQFGVTTTLWDHAFGTYQ